MLSTQCQKILVDVEVYIIVGTKHSLTENAQRRIISVSIFRVTFHL